MTDELHYLEDASPREAMEGASDMLGGLSDRIGSTIKTLDGLMGGALQNDLRSLMLVAELIGGLRETVEGVAARVVVDLTHLEEQPPRRAIAQALGYSVTKVNAIAASATPYPEDGG